MTSQTAAKKCEDWGRAKPLKNSSLGTLTAAEQELIKSYKIVELESSGAK